MHVVDSLYLGGTEMIDPMPNGEWFLTANYPHFHSVLSASGLRQFVYFNGMESVAASYTQIQRII